MDNLAIDLPFGFSNGRIKTVSDAATIWKSRVSNVMYTQYGSRLMRPDFGTNLSSTLFESEGYARTEAQRTITIAFNTHLSALKLVDVATKYDKSTGTIELDIRYKLPSGAEDSVTLTTATFNQYGNLI